MPDKRRKGAKAYSTHPPTVRVRRRLQRMDATQRQIARSRDAEYQAVWQACARATKKDNYRRASVTMRKMLLLSVGHGLMEKRQPTLGSRERQGRTMCNLDVEAMVERHLEREATERALLRSGKPVQDFSAFKGVAVDPENGDDDDDDDDEPETDRATDNDEENHQKPRACPPAPVTDMRPFPDDSAMTNDGPPRDRGVGSSLKPEDEMLMLRHEMELLRNTNSNLEMDVLSLSCQYEDLLLRLRDTVARLENVERAEWARKNEVLQHELSMMDGEGAYVDSRGEYMGTEGTCMGGMDMLQDPAYCPGQMNMN